MICQHEVQTGKPCSNGYSREIACVYSKTHCLRDCGPACKHFEPASRYGTWAMPKRKDRKNATPCTTCGKQVMVFK